MAKSTKDGAPERVFFNRAQLEAMVIDAHDMYIVGGRGLGKSEGFDARVMLRNVFEMPRGTGAILAPSYAKLKTQTFPAIARALARWGYEEGLHYIAGSEPPKHLYYDKPVIPPREYANCLTFYNGSLVHFVSFDRPMSTNSMSLDWVIGPEAKFLSHAKITGEVLPAIRGNRHLFGELPHHGSTFFSTDLPTDGRGAWILEAAANMDRELILYIIATYIRVKQLENSKTRSRKHEAALLRKKLNNARRRALYFGIYSSLDNLEVLGEEWFLRQQRDLPEAVFRASILSEKVRGAQGGYYASFNPEEHCYTPPSALVGEDTPVNARGASLSCAWDTDIQQGESLLIACDYNAAINTMVVAQREGERGIRVLRSLFVKSPATLVDLCEEFTSYYRTHRPQHIFYYYDHTAVSRSASSGFSFSDVVVKNLENAGWSVYRMHIGQAPKHAEKYRYLEAAFRGDSAIMLYPRLNATGCEPLVEALVRARVYQGRNGFAKDKRPEKLPDGVDYPDEYKTHITDAFDTLIVGASLYRTDADSGSGIVML